MTFNNLLFEETDGGIATVAINRPKALNALNTETLKELDEVFKKLDLDNNIRVVVLTGSGDKAFIAGADIAEMQGKNVAQGVAFSKLGQGVTKRIEMLSKPVIAAVNGFALGGGAEMAISCDFIFASDTAIFGLPEVGLGIIPGFGATIRLARFVGWPRAKELVFSGRKLDTAEALQMGLVNRVVPRAEFKPKVIEFARSIGMQSASAIRSCKKLMNEFMGVQGLSYQLDAEAVEFGHLFTSADQKEGMTAFVEKRKPNFNAKQILPTLQGQNA